MPSSIQSRPIIVVLCGAAIGTVVIGALAMYFRRRRNKKGSLYGDVTEPLIVSEKAPSIAASSKHFNTSSNNSRRHLLSTSIHSEDLKDISRSSSPNNTLRRSGSFASDHSDVNSTITVLPFNSNLPLSPVQLFESGMDLVMKARSRWELAIRQLDDEVSLDADGSNLRTQLKKLIELADKIKANCGDQMISQLCADVAADAVLSEMKKDFEAGKRRVKGDEASISDDESFYSTYETLDYSNLEEHLEAFQHLALYEEGLKEVQENNVEYRCLRTQQMQCSSDSEFLAKLYGIRLAFEDILSIQANRDWFVVKGRELVTSMLIHSNKEPEHFQTSYDAMMEYLRELNNWDDIEAELRDKDVKCMTFYDILIDFLLFDAFDDLDMAPPTLISAINNRWVSNSFKQVAVLTFVWGALKAKKAMLKVPDGFMSRFYAISEYTSPVFGWGFLGPEGPNKKMCVYFKEQIMGFMQNIFSFTRVRYTCVSELSEDIMRLAKVQVEDIIEKMSIDPALWP